MLMNSNCQLTQLSSKVEHKTWHISALFTARYRISRAKVGNKVSEGKFQALGCRILSTFEASPYRKTHTNFTDFLKAETCVLWLKNAVVLQPSAV
jgi:hypothetical protein